jgi:hypothetical protein
MKINFEVDITLRRIADLMVAAIEGNQYTRAWCSGVYWKDESASPPKGDTVWYDDPKTYEGDFKIQVNELQEDAKPKAYHLGPNEFKEGLEIMARQYPRHFIDILDEGEDAGTADVFLQCVTLKDVIYS